MADGDRGDAGEPRRRRSVASDVTIDVAGDSVDLATVERIARAALDAHRAGRRLHVVGASPELFALIRFVGLGRVVDPGGLVSPRTDRADRRAERAARYRGRT